MTRCILSVFVALLATQAAAQDWRELRRQEFLDNFPYKYEVRLGWSGYPLLEALNFPNGVVVISLFCQFFDFSLFYKETIVAVLAIKTSRLH